MFDKLFTPLKVGRVALPNRIAFMAHRTNLADRGIPGDRLMAYYERRARGGAGLVVIGEWSLHPPDRPWEGLMRLPAAESRQPLSHFLERVHQKGTRVFCRLNHHGFQGSGAITRLPVWGPSAVADIAFGETAKAMEEEDMEEVVTAFSQAAARVRDAGFDGIELDMGPESLLRQFLSPICNHRGDSFGGSLDNRMRFPLRVLDGIRRGAGDDFTVGVRLTGDEQFWGGITTEESIPMARTFQDTGQVDFFHVVIGTYYNLHLQMPSMHVPAGLARETTKRIKESVEVPVFGGQYIDFPGMAEEMIANGEADAVGLVRQLICDPDAPRKTAEGRVDAIRPCLRDNEGCIGRVNRSRKISCTLNPDVGYEHKMKGSDSSAGQKKKVMVIGAGPAGMEAAVSACGKGHVVTLYEKSPGLGGQVNLQKSQPGRGMVERMIAYYEKALGRAGVRVLTSVEVTPELVQKEAPDSVIVATGSSPIDQPVPGDYGPPRVQTVNDVLERRYPLGDNILFVDEDGGHHAAATVEFLLDQGKKVTMVTSQVFIGIGLAPLGDLYLTRQRLLQKGAVFMEDVSVDEICGDRVVAHHVFTGEPVRFDPFDTLVLDMGRKAEDGLYFRLKNRVKECYRVGDCVAPRDVPAAVYEGRGAGEKL